MESGVQFCDRVQTGTPALHQIVAGSNGYVLVELVREYRYIDTPHALLCMDGEDKVASSIAVNSTTLLSWIPHSLPMLGDGINSLVVMVYKSDRLLFGEISVTFTDNETSYKSRYGHTFEESDDYPDFQYRPWYENVSVLRQVRHDDISGETYRVFSYHLDSVEQYNEMKSVLNGFDGGAILKLVKEKNLLNDMVIVDNEIRFNNPNSSGFVPNMERVSMDNSQFNDVNLLIGIKDVDFYLNNGESYRPSMVYKFRWDSGQEKLLVDDSRVLQYGTDVGFLGHNMSIDPKGRLVIPVGFTHDENAATVSHSRVVSL